MKCSQCNGNKLSKEFPLTMVTERCDHIPSFCLQCLIKKLDLTNISNKEIRKCPECSEELSPDEEEFLLLSWNKALFKIDLNNIGKVKYPQKTSEADETGEIYIILLNGQKYTLQFNESKNIFTLRKEIRNKLNIDESKQKLVYNGVELQDRKSGTLLPNTLQDYNIGPGSHIQLIVVLYNIKLAELIKNLKFDLFWGYPKTGEDYLDGSCLVYEGAKFVRKYDFVSQFYPPFPHMRHEGDDMDEENQTGHHHITAELDKLPAEVTQLYFVLSSYESPTIGHFKTPSFKLIDETQPDEPLCAYQLDQAADSQAVIMCCVSRYGQGWEVIQIGKLSDGNVKDYKPIEESIKLVNLSE